MELETLNKLYLELSHVATVRTSREVDLETLLARATDVLKSAAAVASRAGLDTNWPKLEATVRRVLAQIADLQSDVSSTGTGVSPTSNLQSAIYLPIGGQSEDDHD